MTRKLILAFSALMLFVAAPALAQQSSKSKSKDRFREKDDANNIIRLRNATALNSNGTDYSPVFYKDDGIVYVSSRQKNGPQDKKTKETFFELYYSPFDPNKEPATPQKFSLEINSSLHEGPVTFDREAKTMFFTRNNMHKGVQKADNRGIVRLKIYQADRGPVDWQNLRELPFNSDDYSCLHPSLSIDGEHLYFASDMPGGFGGFDLYRSDKDPGGAWGTPVNLGPDVNSDKNELFPFIHEGGTLFFASDGHNTLGGLDLFFVDQTADGQTAVVNLGEPFNSKEDDLGFILNSDGTRGFLSSSRAGGYGKDDVYSFTIEKGIKGVEKPVAQPVQILVTDARTGQPIQGASIHILKQTEGGFAGSSDQSFYNVDLMPIQDRPNALNFQLVRKNASDLGKPDLLTNAVGEARSDFLRYRTYLLLANFEGFQTSEKFYSMDEDGTGIVRIAMSPAPTCYHAGGIVGTETFGTRIANANLRFIHKVSGHIELVRTNQNGQYDLCLPLEGDYLVQVDRDGFKPDNFSATVVKGQVAFNEIRLRPAEVGLDAEATLPLAAGLKPGTVIVMDKIKYEQNKATLNQTAVRHLDALYDLMVRYPEMEIDLVSHTDTRGDANANLELSTERAKNAKTYLIYRGIADKRINAIGKGGTEPRNQCAQGVTCSDAEHLINVRTEIRIRRIGA